MPADITLYSRAFSPDRWSRRYIDLQSGKQSQQQVKSYPHIVPYGACMNRAAALKILTQSKPILADRFGVTRLALFGSTARDAAESGSDIDILVGFDGPATSARYFGVQFFLEDLFGCPVDLVTEKALRAELRPYIESEAVHV